MKLSLLSLILFVSLAGWSQNRPVHSSRIEELFIWKISEELKLSVKEEKSVSTLISELNQKKLESNSKIEEITDQLAKSDSAASSRKLLRQYRAALVDYNKISTEEVDRIQKILSPDKVTKYFVVKSDLSKKIRNLLALPERSHDHVLGEHNKAEKATLGDPKIIEE